MRNMKLKNIPHFKIRGMPFPQTKSEEMAIVSYMNVQTESQTCYRFFEEMAYSSKYHRGNGISSILRKRKLKLR